MMFRELLNKCILGSTLTEKEAEEVMNQIMSGNATDSQIASLLTILRFRGETIEEMTGFAKAMRNHMTVIQYEHEVIDTCGTGGDQSSTFNISTAAAIVVSSLGIKVAKHGNRAVSSKSGSADVLEHLGIEIQVTSEDAKRALSETGMSFLFAPLYHSAMKHVAKPRKDIGFRTVFNLLGPLANPARCKKQVIGVYSPDYALKMAYTLKNLGSEHVLLVAGKDGLDECSISAETFVVELKNGSISQFELSPEDVGLPKGNLNDIQVSTVAESAALIEKIMYGRGNQSARNIVLLNAGAALYVSGTAKSISEGVQLAKYAIESGRAAEQFQRLQKRKVNQYA
jgi:anthranilate phosphoribosyltransferase